MRLAWRAGRSKLRADADCRAFSAFQWCWVYLMIFVESLTALLCSFLLGLVLEWVLLRGLFKLIEKHPPEPISARNRS